MRQALVAMLSVSQGCGGYSDGVADVGLIRTEDHPLQTMSGYGIRIRAVRAADFIRTVLRLASAGKEV